MVETARSMSTEPNFLLYDGECPFCSAFVRMQRLRAAGIGLRLLDAREETQLVADFARKGMNVNEGMILSLGGTNHFGGDVVHMLALMTGPTNVLNRVMGWVFRNRTAALLLYPLLRFMRNAALRLLGRDKIDIGDTTASRTV